MFVSFKFKYSIDVQRFYAVGERTAAIQACRSAFRDLGWAIHKEEDCRLIHYPGGILDRASSAYVRSISWEPTTHSADTIAVEYMITNNPAVTLIEVYIYMKQKMFSRSKDKRRIVSFYQALTSNATLLNIALVPQARWDDLTAARPGLACSPVWR